MDSSQLAEKERLAAALRGEGQEWPRTEDASKVAALADAAIYHGVAGLLVDRAEALRSWPDRLADTITEQARAQAMWEVRHRQLLSELLTALAAAGVDALLMKGTAIAYDLYDNPAARARGDTDLLISVRDRPSAEAVLARLGYEGGALGGVKSEFALQRPWTLTLADGGRHSIDLHWQAMNAPSLRDLLTFEECAANSQPLPRLSPQAKGMDRVRLLIHTCLHRAMHDNTPYFVAGATYYGSGRLIWSYDIHLLAGTLDDAQWSELVSLTARTGVSRVCRDGLLEARSSLATEITDDVIRELELAAAKDRASAYFVPSRALTRAWQDMRAVPGLPAKWRYARARILPDADFVRAKYPQLAKRGLPILYARRLLALLRPEGTGR